MQILLTKPLTLDALRLQLSRKRKLSAIIERHINFYEKSSESDRLNSEIEQLQERIDDIEQEL